MLEGTIYAGLESEIMDPTPENLEWTYQETQNAIAEWGRIMQVRNSKNEDILTPGLVVLEIPSVHWDRELARPFMTRDYWLATNKKVHWAKPFVSNNLRLGQTLGIICPDFGLADGTPFMTGELGSYKSLEPLDLLISYDGIKNATQCREYAKLALMKEEISEELGD